MCGYRTWREGRPLSGPLCRPSSGGATGIASVDACAPARRAMNINVKKNRQQGNELKIAMDCNREQSSFNVKNTESSCYSPSRSKVDFCQLHSPRGFCAPPQLWGKSPSRERYSISMHIYGNRALWLLLMSFHCITLVLVNNCENIFNSPECYLCLLHLDSLPLALFYH